jgi:ferrochelatase
MRYWHPYIAESLAELAALGCERVVTVSLSPFESKAASGAYRQAIEEAVLADGLGHLEVVEAPLVSELPEFAVFLAESTRTAIGTLPDTRDCLVAFTAHSLPESDLVADDPYVAGLRATATAVAEQLGWEPGSGGMGAGFGEESPAFGTAEGPQPWVLVYQSKGVRPGAWLGPGLDELIEASAGTGIRSLVVCPIGFMTDHMETLFDLDTVAAVKAAEAGVVFVRAPVPNADAFVVDALADAVATLL